MGGPDRLGRPDAHRGASARAGLRLVRGGDPGHERMAASLVPGGRGMVAPYLSRLRPAESGLRARPRSRFEPAPTLPIDGLAGAGFGLSPPPPDAALAEVEAEGEPDPSYRHPAGPPI